MNERKLAEARAELGLGNRLPGKLVVENAAKAQGREEDLPNYLTASEFTHGAYSALKVHVVHHENEERSTFHLDQQLRLDVQEAAANLAGRSALLGYRSACRIFGVLDPESLGELLDLIEFTDVEGVE